jgi:hypothetical protein
MYPLTILVLPLKKTRAATATATTFQNENEEKRILLRVYNTVTETEFILCQSNVGYGRECEKNRNSTHEIS